jgi:hypothetical protein
MDEEWIYEFQKRAGPRLMRALGEATKDLPPHLGERLDRLRASEAEQGCTESSTPPKIDHQP